ncbi:hypothetical protein IKE71_01530 [Candidatus Saccharibacteria bacterium]|nr:hypothetical protein [Candidatus Saccharibacteria bacterium]
MNHSPESTPSSFEYAEELPTRDRFKNLGKRAIDFLKSKQSQESDRPRDLYHEAKSALESNDFYRGRRLASEYIFGLSPAELGRDLVALGAVKESSDRPDFSAPEPEGVFGSELSSWWDESLKLELGPLDDLRLDAHFSEEEKLAAKTAFDFLTSNDSDLEGILKDSKSYRSFGEKLTELRKSFRERATKNYSEFMTESITAAATQVGETEFDGNKIPILKIAPDSRYGVLIHRLSGVTGDKSAFSHPELWDQRTPDGFDADGRPVGYISTSLNTDRLHSIAAQSNDELDDSIFYGFTDLGDYTLRFTSELDLSTHVTETSPDDLGVTVGSQDYFYDDPRDLEAATLKRQESDPFHHNEVVLNRWDLSGDRLRPDYLISYGSTGNISEATRRHAAYFDAPILLLEKPETPR